MFNAARKEALKADLMLIVGSSLEVAPAGDMPVFATRNGARLIIINLEATPDDSLAEVVIRDNATSVLPSIMRRLEAMQ